MFDPSIIEDRSRYLHARSEYGEKADKFCVQGVRILISCLLRQVSRMQYMELDG